MLTSWFNLAMLALESQKVVGLRLTRLAWGGSSAWSEAQLMVSEKVREAHHATGRLMMGDTPDSIVTRYRETIQANVLRLSRPSGRDRSR